MDNEVECVTEANYKSKFCILKLFLLLDDSAAWQAGREGRKWEPGESDDRHWRARSGGAGRRLISSLQITLIRLEGGRNNEALLDPLPYCQS